MKLRSKIALTGALTLGFTTAAAAAAYHYNTRGDGAHAELFSYDGCSYQDVFVQAFQNSSQSDGGPPSTSSGAWMEVNRENWCTGDFTFGSTFSNALTFHGQGTSGASLSGTVPFDEFGYVCNFGQALVFGEGEGEGEGSIGEGEGSLGEGEGEGGGGYGCNWVDTVTTATFDVSWSGTGDTFRGTSQGGATGPAGVMHERETGSYRDAIVSGTISIDGVNLLANPEYASGEVSTASQGQVDVYHN